MTASRTLSREISLPDLEATAALAGRLAAVTRPGDVILLRGELGAGKTAFARAFIAARAGAPIEAPSPTFTLVQAYDLPDGSIWHFDLYRVEAPDEVDELGFDEALAGGIVLVEWPERLGGRLPPGALILGLDFAGQQGARLAHLEGAGDWPERLQGLLSDG